MALAGTKRKHCPHCDEYVALSTFKYHKRLYFDEVTGLIVYLYAKLRGYSEYISQYT